MKALRLDCGPFLPPIGDARIGYFGRHPEGASYVGAFLDGDQKGAYLGVGLTIQSAYMDALLQASVQFDTRTIAYACEHIPLDSGPVFSLPCPFPDNTKPPQLYHHLLLRLERPTQANKRAALATCSQDS